MRLLDHHMHSRISFDSKEDLERQLLTTNNVTIKTEHLDSKDPVSNFINRSLNYLCHRNQA